MHERERSGRGQFIDTALYDSAMSLMHPHFPNYFLSGKIPGLTGNTHGNLAPYGMFPTKTCRVMIGAGNNRAFQRVCVELGVPEMAEDPRFTNNADRIKNRDELNRIITERLSQVDGMEFSLKLLKAGLPCGPVLNAEQALNHPHAAARGTIIEKDWYKGIATPVKLSRTPGSLKAPPPKFSQHAREVLAEHGFDEGAVERLIAAGVLVEKRRS
jgi:formyl-CoA transferase